MMRSEDGASRCEIIEWAHWRLLASEKPYL
jgi:hypothetical protein